MKKRILQLVLLICPMVGFAQQDPMISQYMFTGMVLNPAYAGSHEHTNATALYRTQWVSFETDNATGDWSPNTMIATVDGKIRNANLAWGVVLGRDNIGVTSKNDAIANFAYLLPAGKNGTISVGLRAGLSFINSDLATVQTVNANDPTFVNGTENKVLGNFGAGAYYYTKKFYLGLSLPNVLENNLSSEFSNQVRHFYGHTGLVIEVSDNFAIKPSILMKYVATAPVEFDFNINFLIAQKFWIGGSYRTGDSWVGILELQVTNNLRIGYAYDKLFSELQTYSTGSHEFMISYDFGVAPTKLKSPRYF